MPSSDHLSALRAYAAWDAAVRAGERSDRAAQRLGLNATSLMEIKGLRLQLYETLLDARVLVLPPKQPASATHLRLAADSASRGSHHARGPGHTERQRGNHTATHRPSASAAGEWVRMRRTLITASDRTRP